MSMFKDYIIIHLQLIYIDALEVFILLMTSLIKCVFQIKQKSFQNNCRNKLIKTIYNANMNINANINVNLIWDSVIQIKSGILIHVDKNPEKHYVCEKNIYIGNSACKSGKYLENIIDNSVITWDKTIDAEDKFDDEETNAVTKNFNEKNAICKTKNFYILVAFLLITTALLIAVSIYCSLIKYSVKHKHFIAMLHNKLKKFCINNVL